MRCLQVYRYESGCRRRISSIRKAVAGSRSQRAPAIPKPRKRGFLVDPARCAGARPAGPAIRSADQAVAPERDDRCASPRGRRFAAVTEEVES